MWTTSFGQLFILDLLPLKPLTSLAYAYLVKTEANDHEAVTTMIQEQQSFPD
jgi:hypothetical protein